MRGIVWFKKDLRIIDNPALYAASQQCTDGIVATYIIDPTLWHNHSVSHNQIQFILNGLQQLKIDLAKLHIPLIVETVTQTTHIPDLLVKITEQVGAGKIFFNRELEVNEKKRDQLVKSFCEIKQIHVEDFNDQLILDVDQVKTNNNSYFKVFTPFKRQWQYIFLQTSTMRMLPKIREQAPLQIASSSLPTQLNGVKSTINFALWVAGETAAQKQLKRFIQNDLFDYDKTRDYPALDLTSKLSPYLATGMISVKTCFLSAFTANQEELTSGNKGALTWLNELIWREFYRHILHAFPAVCMNHAYKRETEKLPWRYDENLLAAWQEGRTGFPIIDAAMRQLQTIGWMHNRLRMLAAMFLSKNLFLDWRLGEKFFAEHLIDFDFASNNGGWQWCASTGTDAVPYFRLFNPTTQSQKFDAEGNFIKQYCPELRAFDHRAIHEPYRFQPTLAEKSGYPRPIIDYPQSRQRVLSAFKALS